MRRLSGLPGWLLAVVWLAVPAAAAALVVGSLRSGEGSDSDTPGAGLGATEVDVQTAALQAQRERLGVADCSGLPVGAEPVDGGLPDVTLPCLGGAGAVDLASLEGPAVLNVWAQWCGPCRREMPVFQQLHERVDGLTVLGVDFRDLQPEDAIAFAGEVGATYPSVADVDEVLRGPLRLVNLPTTLFVDADGRLVATEVREYPSYAELTAAVEEHLGVEV